MSKQATAGSARQRRAAPRRARRATSAGAAARARSARRSARGDLVVDHRRRAEALAAVHDAVADGVGLARARRAPARRPSPGARSRVPSSSSPAPSSRSLRLLEPALTTRTRTALRPPAASSRGRRAGRRRARACTRGARRRSSTISWRSPAARCAEAGHPVDHVHDQVEAVDVVEHDHVERRRGRALLLVAAHVQVVVVRAPVGQPVDQPRVAVVGEDHRPVGGEQRVELARRTGRAGARARPAAASGRRR